MPRQVVIAILLVLIIGVVGGTAAIIIDRLRSHSLTSPSPSPGEGLPLSAGDPNIEGADDDNDGLSNIEEARWGTDPTKSDTDRDGFSDGQEVAARHNPTVAAPNDLLPDDFVLPSAPSSSRGPRPSPPDLYTYSLRDFLDASPSVTPLITEPLQPERYFEKNYLAALSGPNLTEVWHASGQTDVVAFVKAQPILTVLPYVTQEEVRVAPSVDATALQTYLEGVENLSLLHSANVISFDFRTLVNFNDTRGISEEVTHIGEAETQLRQLDIQPEAVALHRFLLAYATAMRISLERVTRWGDDRVGALVAMRQVDALDRMYFPIIQAEIARLRQ